MFLQSNRQCFITLTGKLYANSSHYLLSWLFLRGLALIYFAAFASMAVQIEGLIGDNGILPIQSRLQEIYAYYLPHWFNQLCVAGVLVIELVIPFFVFLSRRFRLVAAWSFIALQFSIILTGNYNFFNLLTILLCLFLFDDADVESRLPVRLVVAITRKKASPGPLAHACAAVWMGLVLLTCAVHIWIAQVRQMPVAPLTALVRMTSAFSLVNNYGPFAVMTTERNEIILQGSSDGTHWQTYQFKYKPVSLDQKPVWNIPHQPRLDWQMWFAAMETPEADSWFARFMSRLQQGSPQVLALLGNHDFVEKPPLYLRALLYRYFYTTPEQRAATGQSWRREYLGVYWPPPTDG